MKNKNIFRSSPGKSPSPKSLLKKILAASSLVAITLGSADGVFATEWTSKDQAYSEIRYNGARDGLDGPNSGDFVNEDSIKFGGAHNIMNSKSNESFAISSIDFNGKSSALWRENTSKTTIRQIKNATATSKFNLLDNQSVIINSITNSNGLQIQDDAGNAFTFGPNNHEFGALKLARQTSTATFDNSGTISGTLDGGKITYSTTAGKTITQSGAVGANASLISLATTGNGNATFNAAVSATNISAGALNTTFKGDVTGDVVIQDAKTATFATATAGKVDGAASGKGLAVYDTSIKAADITQTGEVGGANALASLTTTGAKNVTFGDAVSATNISVGALSTTFKGDVTGDVVIQDAKTATFDNSGGTKVQDVTISGTLDGGSVIFATSSIGSITQSAAVGATNALVSLATTGDGNATFSDAVSATNISAGALNTTFKGDVTGAVDGPSAAAAAGAPANYAVYDLNRNIKGYLSPSRFSYITQNEGNTGALFTDADGANLDSLQILKQYGNKYYVTNGVSGERVTIALPSNAIPSVVTYDSSTSAITQSGIVGGTAGLASLTTTGGNDVTFSDAVSATNISLGALNTTFKGDVTGDIVIPDAKTATFAQGNSGKVDGANNYIFGGLAVYDTSIKAADITQSGAIGGTKALASLTTKGGNTVTFGDAVSATNISLGALSTTFQGDVTGYVDGLTANTNTAIYDASGAADITQSGIVGGTNPLASLTTQGANSVTFGDAVSATSISVGALNTIFKGDVTGDVVIPDAKTATFAQGNSGKVDGAASGQGFAVYDTLIKAADITQTEAVGRTAALASVATTGPQSVTFNNTVSAAKISVGAAATNFKGDVTGAVDGDIANTNAAIYDASGAADIMQSGIVGGTKVLASLTTTGGKSVTFDDAVSATNISAGALNTTFKGDVTGDIVIQDAKTATFAQGNSGKVDGATMGYIFNGLAVYDTSIKAADITQSGAIGGTKALAILATRGADSVTFGDAVNANGVSLGALNTTFKNDVTGNVYGSQENSPLWVETSNPRLFIYSSPAFLPQGYTMDINGSIRKGGPYGDLHSGEVDLNDISGNKIGYVTLKDGRYDVAIDMHFVDTDTVGKLIKPIASANNAAIYDASGAADITQRGDVSGLASLTTAGGNKVTFIDAVSARSISVGALNTIFKGDVTGAVNGAQINTNAAIYDASGAADITQIGAIGGTKALASLTTTGGNSVTFNNKVSAAKISVGAAATTFKGDVTGAVDGDIANANAAIYDASGAADITQTGEVGLTTALASVATTGTKSVTFGDAVSATNISVGALNTTFKGDVTGAVDGLIANANTAIYDASSGVNIGQSGAVGGTRPFASVVTTGAKNVTFGDAVSATGISLGALNTTFKGAITGNVVIQDAKTATFATATAGKVDGAASGKGLAVYDTSIKAADITQSGAVGGTNALASVATTGTKSVTFGDAVSATGISAGALSTIFKGDVTGAVDGAQDNANAAIYDASGAADITQTGEVGGANALASVATTGAKSVTFNAAVNATGISAGALSTIFKGDVTGAVDGAQDNANAAIYDASSGVDIGQSGAVGGTKALASVATTGTKSVTFNAAVNATGISAGALNTTFKSDVTGDVVIQDASNAIFATATAGKVDGAASGQGFAVYDTSIKAVDIMQSGDVGGTAALASVATKGAKSVTFNAAVNATGISLGALNTTFKSPVNSDVLVANGSTATFAQGNSGKVDGASAGVGNVIYNGSLSSGASVPIVQTGAVGGTNALASLTTTGPDDVNFSGTIKAKYISLGTNVNFRDNVDTTVNSTVGDIKFTIDKRLKALDKAIVVTGNAATDTANKGTIDASVQNITWKGNLGSSAAPLGKLVIGGAMAKNFTSNGVAAYFHDLTFGHADSELQLDGPTNSFVVTNALANANKGIIHTLPGTNNHMNIDIDTSSQGINKIQLNHNTRGAWARFLKPQLLANGITSSGLGNTEFNEKVIITAGGISHGGTGELNFVKPTTITAGDASVSAAGILRFKDDVTLTDGNASVTAPGGFIRFWGSAEFEALDKGLNTNQTNGVFRFSLLGSDRTVTLNDATKRVITSSGDNQGILNVLGSDSTQKSLSFNGASLTDLSNYQLKAITIDPNTNLDVGKLNVKTKDGISFFGSNSQFTANATANQAIDSSIIATASGNGAVSYTAAGGFTLTHTGAIGSAAKPIGSVSALGGGTLAFGSDIYAQSLSVANATKAQFKGSVSAPVDGTGNGAGNGAIVIYDSSVKSITQSGIVGATNPLASLTTTGANDVTFSDAVKATNISVGALNTTFKGDVTGAVDGFAANANTAIYDASRAVDITQSGIVGGTNSLAKLTTTGGNGVTFSDAVSANNISLAALSTTFKGDVTGAVDGDINGAGVVIYDATSPASLRQKGPVGLTKALASVITTGDSIVSFNDVVNATALQAGANRTFFKGPVTGDVVIMNDKAATFSHSNSGKVDGFSAGVGIAIYSGDHSSSAPAPIIQSGAVGSINALARIITMDTQNITFNDAVSATNILARAPNTTFKGDVTGDVVILAAKTATFAKATLGKVDGDSADQGFAVYDTSIANADIIQSAAVGATKALARVATAGNNSVTFIGAINATAISAGALNTTFKSALDSVVTIENTKTATFAGNNLGTVDSPSGPGNAVYNGDLAAVPASIVQKGAVGGTASLGSIQTLGSQVVTFQDVANASSIIAGASNTIFLKSTTGDITIANTKTATFAGNNLGTVDSMGGFGNAVYNGDLAAVPASIVQNGAVGQKAILNSVTTLGSRAVTFNDNVSAGSIVAGASNTTFSKAVNSNVTIENTKTATFGGNVSGFVDGAASGYGLAIYQAYSADILQSSAVGGNNLLAGLKTEGTKNVTFAGTVKANAIEIGTDTSFKADVYAPLQGISFSRDKTLKALDRAIVVTSNAFASSSSIGTIDATAQGITWIGNIGTKDNILKELKIGQSAGFFKYNSGQAYFHDLTFDNADSELQFAGQENTLFTITNFTAPSAAYGVIHTLPLAAALEPLFIDIDTSGNHGIKKIQLDHNAGPGQLNDVIFMKPQLLSDGIESTGLGSTVFKDKVEISTLGIQQKGAGSLEFDRAVTITSGDALVAGDGAEMFFHNNVTFKNGKASIKAAKGLMYFGGEINFDDSKGGFYTDKSDSQFVFLLNGSNKVVNFRNANSKQAFLLGSEAQGSLIVTNTGSAQKSLTFQGSGLQDLSDKQLQVIALGENTQLDVGKMNVETKDGIIFAGPNAKFTAETSGTQYIYSKILSSSDYRGTVSYKSTAAPTSLKEKLLHSGEIGSSSAPIGMLYTYGQGKVHFLNDIYASQVILTAGKSKVRDGDNKTIFLTQKSDKITVLAHDVYDVVFKGDVQVSQSGDGAVIYDATKNIWHEGTIGQEKRSIGTIETVGAGSVDISGDIFADDINLRAANNKLEGKVYAGTFDVDADKEVLFSSDGSYNIGLMNASGASIINTGTVTFASGAHNIGTITNKDSTNDGILTFKGGNIAGSIEGGTLDAAGVFTGNLGSSQALTLLNIAGDSIFQGKVNSTKTTIDNQGVKFAQDSSLGSLDLNNATIDVGLSKIEAEEITNMRGLNKFTLRIDPDKNGQVMGKRYPFASSGNLKLDVNLYSLDLYSLDEKQYTIGDIFDDADISSIKFNLGEVKVNQGVLSIKSTEQKELYIAQVIAYMNEGGGNTAVFNEVIKNIDADTTLFDRSETVKEIVKQLAQGEPDDVSNAINNNDVSALTLSAQGTGIEAAAARLSNAPSLAPKLRVVSSGQDNDQDNAGRIATWFAGHSSKGDQKLDALKPGYKAINAGATFGADYFGDIYGNGFIFGGAFTFDNGNIKYNKGVKKGDNTKIYSNIFSLYTSVNIYENLFARGIVSYGSSTIESKVFRNDKIAVADYKSDLIATQLEAGYNYVIGNLNAIGLLGARYNNIRTPAYEEKLARPFNHTVRKSTINQVDVIGSVGASTTILSQDFSFEPSATFALAKKVSGKAPAIKYTIGDMPKEMKLSSGKQAALSAEISVGLNMNYQVLNLGLNASYGFAKKYSNVGGSLMVRAEF